MACKRCVLVAEFEEKDTKIPAKLTSHECIPADFGKLQYVSARYDGSVGDYVIVTVDNQHLIISADLTEEVKEVLKDSIDFELPYPGISVEDLADRAKREQIKFYLHDGDRKTVTAEILKSLGTKTLWVESVEDEQIKNLNEGDIVEVLVGGE